MSVRDDQARRPQGQAPRVVRAEGLDWVKFDRQLARDGSVPTTWKALYAALASFADQDSRETPDGLEDDEDVPTRARLAECIGKSVDTVDRATKGLEGLGLLEVERRQDPDNPKRNIPSLYRLLDHEIWDERAAERAARRKAEREARASARAAKTQAEEQTGGGRTHAARGSRTHAATLAAPMRPGWPHGCGGSSSSLEDLSQTVRDESAQREREAAAPGESAAVDLVLAGWAAGAGVQRPPASVRGELVGQVAELAAEYTTREELRTIAEFAGHRRWIDLGRAALHPECEKRLAAIRPRLAKVGGREERCPDHPARYRKGCPDCAMAVPA